MKTLERFSTRGVSASNRVSLWEAHNDRALVGLECRTLTDDPFEASEMNLQFDSLHLAHVTANAHVVERSSRHIARTPLDAVALYFTLFGESFFYTSDGVHVQRPGAMLACDANEPFLRGFAHGVEEFVLTIPRSVFHEIADAPMPKQPITMRFAGLSGTNVHATALAQLVRGSLESHDDETSAATEATAMNLLRSMFSADEARSAAAHRRAALAVIDRRLRDPRLSVGEIAHEIGLSERQLSRTFSETGTGVARIVLERRLDLALRMLQDSSGSASIAAVAEHCGFTSHSHFTRVFRERYEETPGDARARTAAS